MTQIPRLVLDPRSEEQLLGEMYLRAVIASGGTITDTRQGSPIAAIYEGTAYAMAELLWYLNLLPEAVALEVMRYSTGLERIDGTAASGTFTFILKAVRGSDFVILKDSFRVPYLDAYWKPDVDIVIPAGVLQVEANMTCSQVGSRYNLESPLDLNIDNPGLTGLGRVYNTSAITNGTEIEPLETTLSRMQAFIRRGESLVTATDYEEALEALMGAGSRAHAIPLMNGDYQRDVPGHVSVFGVLPDGSLPTASQCLSYLEQISGNAFAGSYTWVKAVTYDTIDVDISLLANDLTSTTAFAVGNAIASYLDFRTYEFGRALTIGDLEYVARRSNEDTVISVLFTSVNGDTVDVPLSQAWALPKLRNCNVTLTNGVESYTYYAGQIDEAE